MPVSLPLNCDGPPGTIAAPLGECEGEVTETDMVAIQTELWTSIFGTNDVPNLSYNLAPGSEFIGKGEYEGVNAYDVAFAIKVIDYVQAFEPQVVEGDTLDAWHVFAEVTGPTEVAVPVVGLLMKVERGPNSTLPGGMGFLMAGRMLDAMLGTLKSLNKNGAGFAPGGSPTKTQQECIAECNKNKTTAKIIAFAALATATAAATVALVAALAICGIQAGFVPFGTLISGSCAAIAFVTYLGALTTASITLNIALIAILLAWKQCMEGCGVTVAFP